ncbi:MAG: efflux RND transporter periplasmic adaptor subunit [Fibrobacter sp.]|uniref:efflux RND transporter periplasmic adaptor subunit n=1 Tax=uncultured Fibrobacter sp. TaxID=261512 RepID=UPI0025E58D08|nr:efflux RND transporter periplasmic adaptor subunit [uncultured Fibrobacter sp.]MBR6317296.1 efflux RND transporter periplasmic adaptor subunit [Fibrobacter sp.]
MKKLLKIIIVIAILAAIAFGVKKFFFDAKADTAAGPLVSTKVTLATIATTISATGTLEPVDQVEVGTQVSGDISKIYVDFNTKVTKGQVIAELDKSKLRATLTQAEIAYKAAQSDFKFKESTYNRIKKLSESNSASAVDLETAEYNMNSAKLAVEKSQNEVNQAKLNLSYATIKSPISGVVLKRAVDVGQTVAASMSTPTLFIIAKDLSQMKVMADVDEADIGQVKAGQRVEFTVDAYQEDKFSGTVQEVRLSPTTTSNVVTYTVVISAENPDQKLLPGMTATCTIVTQEVEDAIAIPVKALKFTPADGTPMADPKNFPRPPRPEGGEFAKGDFPPPPGDMKGPPPGGFGPPGGPGKFGPPGTFKKRADGKKPSGNMVWVSIDGKAAPRPVKTGISDGVNIQILKGLSVGDSVVVSQETLSEATAKKSEASSPFMPGPPGKKKKK